MEVVLTGEPFSAQEALAWGMVSKVLPQDQLVPEAIRLAERIAANSKLTVTICKASVQSGKCGCVES